MHAPPTPTRATAFIVALALAAAVTAQAAPSAEPSPSERIRCQRALEKVNWSHRSESSGSSFEQAVPEAVAQRIRNAVYQSLFEAGGRPQRVTASVGVGAYPRDGLTPDDVLLIADRHMYKDKNLRRKPGDPEPPRPRRL